MRNRNALLAPASITLFAAVIALAGCRRNAADSNTIRLNGRIESTSVDLAPKIAGRVSEVLVREGARVKAGDLLVRLDLGDTAIAVEREQAGVRSAEARADDVKAGSRSQEIAAAQAELTDRRASLQLAAKENERQTFLLSKRVGTQRDYDRAHTDLERARAAVAASEERLALVQAGARKNQTLAAEADAQRAAAVLKQSVVLAKENEIRAPADGIVLHRLAEPGQLVSPGQPAVTLAFADHLFVRTFIPESQLGRIKVGAAAEVTVDAFPNRTFAAHITEISPDAEFTPKAVETKSERVNLVYGAKADLDRGWSEPLVPGQPAEVVVGGSRCR
jgi:HlyD family secretion protein